MGLIFGGGASDGDESTESNIKSVPASDAAIASKSVFDQLAATLRDFGAALGDYRASLEAGGFTRQEAIHFVAEYHNFYCRRTFGIGTGGGLGGLFGG